MRDNNPLYNISSILTFRNDSSLPISISNNILVFSFILLFTFFFGFISLNDNTALAFKPTVPSDPQENQQQNQKQQPSSSQVADDYVLVKKWGIEGTAEGQVGNITISAREIAIDSEDNIYVTDSKNHRIQKFDSNGNYITQWRANYPTGIAFDLSGNVYVRVYVDDTKNYPIQKFDSNGNYITQWETADYPGNIAVDSSTGNLFLAVIKNHLIQKFDSNGNFITEWNTERRGDGQFTNPDDVAIDSQGNVYMVDSVDPKIHKFDSNGNFITKWGTIGDGPGQFYIPHDPYIAIDSSDNVYVTDSGNNRIQKFDSNGNFITQWGSEGKGDGEFNYVGGIAIDSLDNVYVEDVGIDDVGNNRIQVFAPSSKVRSN